MLLLGSDEEISVNSSRSDYSERQHRRMYISLPILILFCVEASVGAVSHTNTTGVDSFGRSAPAAGSSERPTCIVVAYDKYRGYLNWAQVKQ